MKTSLLSLAFLLVTIQTMFAQLSSPFPQDSATWVISYTCSDDGMNFWSGEETISIDGDTIIDGQNYIILTNDWGDIISFVRVEGSKVYFKNYNGWPSFPDDLDYLIYDFGLGVDDVFEYPDFLWVPPMVTVEAVDTVQFADGINRKRVKLSQAYQNICGYSDYWIEGIGSVPTAFYFMECFECNKNGFEFWSNGEMIFNNVVVIGTNDISQTKINVSPNPATQSFKIEGEYTSIPEVVLYNMTGRAVLRKTNVYNEREIYFPQNMPKGIYFLKIRLDENRIISKKLVIH